MLKDNLERLIMFGKVEEREAEAGRNTEGQME